MAQIGNAQQKAAAMAAELRAGYVLTDRDTDFRRYLDRLLVRDKAGDLVGEPARFTSTAETRGVAVIDGPKGGKTSLISRGLRNHPALPPDPDNGRVPVLAVSVPSPATLKSLRCEILRQSGYPDILERRERWNIWNLVRKRIDLLGVVVLWINEAHDLFGSNNRREIDDILKTLKSLMQGDGAVIVVLSGVDTLWALAKSDRQVARRFAKFALPQVSSATDAAKLQQLMEGYCAKAGLAPPPQVDLVDRLIHASRGRFGRCIENLIAAIEDALDARDSVLDIQHFAEAYAMAEGCEAHRNVFLSRLWADIDPDQPDASHQSGQDGRQARNCR